MIKKIILLILSVTAVFAFTILHRDAGDVVGSDTMVALNTAVSDEPSLRDWNVTQDILTNGDRVANISAGWRNYLTDNGFEPIDTTFRQTGVGFVIDKNPFTAIAPLRSTGTATMINNSKLLVENGQKILVDEPAITQSVVAKGVADVAGRIINEDFGFGKVSAVIYEGAYSSINADLIYFVEGSAPEWKRFIRFNETPVGVDELCFDIEYDQNVQFTRPSKINWGESSRLVNRGHLDMKVKSGTNRGISFKPFIIWDSGDFRTKKKELIDVEITSNVKNRSYTLCKQIPSEFFTNATFPVYTDDTSTFSPSAGSVSPVDGMTQYTSAGAVLATVRSAAATNIGGDASTNDTCAGLAGDDSSDQYNSLWRCHFGFNTSIIGVGATVSSGSIAVYSGGKVDQLGGTGTQALILSYPASDSTIVVGDHVLVQKTRAMTSDIDVGSITSGAYNYFNLNTVGLEHISFTTSTFFAITNGYDIDVSPTWASGGENVVNYQFADSSNDPILTLVYTPAPVANVARGGYYIQF